MVTKFGLRAIALSYLTLLLIFPVALVGYRTFENGIQPVWETLSSATTLHALWLTVLIALIAVPLNTVFGVLCAIMLVRHRFPGRSIVLALLDLPMGVSPVVVGLALVLVYGKFGWFGPWLGDHNVQIIFALPGMVLATMFICLPFVAKEIIPVLEKIGTEQEQAASTLGASGWQTFWRITAPSIRAAVGYGVVLTTARAIGEFGAVSVVSGDIAMRTQTLTLYVQNQYDSFDTPGAYTASLTLAVIAVLSLLLMNVLRGNKER